MEFHLKLAERVIGGRVIKMTPRACREINMVCHTQEVTSRVKDHREAIHKICLSQVDKVPVIVIGVDAKNSL